MTRPTFTRIRAGDVRILAPRDILAFCAVVAAVSGAIALLSRIGA